MNISDIVPFLRWRPLLTRRTHQRIDSNQEFISQGLANIVGSFFSSYASSGSFTRTGLNYEAGARTPMAAVTAAAALALMVLLIAPLTAYLPIASMAGAETLVNEARRLHVTGRQLYLCSLKGEVMEVLVRGGYAKRFGEAYIFRSKSQAIISIVNRLDPERCRECRARIFRKCSAMPAPETSG